MNTVTAPAPAGSGSGQFTPTPNPAVLPELRTRISTDLLADPQNQLFHDLILFKSASMQPIVNVDLGLPSRDEQGNLVYFSEPQLWLLSPDGYRAGLFFGGLMSDDNVFALYLPGDPTSSLQSVETVVHLNHERIQPVPLPPECFSDPAYCRGFTFSPDGQVLGFFFGEFQCGYGLRIISTRSGTDLYFQPASGHFFKFLTNGKVLIASGGCEGGLVNQLDLETGQVEELGDEGSDTFWSPDGLALVVLVHSYPGLGTDLWAYDLRIGKVWLRDSGVIEHVVWSPDSSRFFYSKAVESNRKGNQVTFEPVRLYQALLNEQPQPLLEQALFDDFLCAGAWTGCDWREDWIIVRRYPARPYQLNWDAHDSCFQRGENCPAPPELMALNWRSGELTSWQLSPLARPTAAPTAPPLLTGYGPNMNSMPIYVQPGGNFAFYPGLDGNSLWRVPEVGAPVLWVSDGQHFVYIP